MTDVKRKSKKPSSTAKSISSVLGIPPTLPGESAEEYQQGLQSLIEELEAKTVMQVYLADKIFECLWWIRRYEQQKRATIARAMTEILAGNVFLISLKGKMRLWISFWIQHVGIYWMSCLKNQTTLKSP